MNMTVLNNDAGSVVFELGDFRDELLTFAGAGTVLAGTILARDSASLKLVPFVKGGVANGNGIPKAMLTYDVTSTGAGDVPIRAMVSGSVRFPKLIIDADADNSNVDNAVMDGMRNYGIVTVNTNELAILDNQ